jgi:hypothetical protein
MPSYALREQTNRRQKRIYAVMVHIWDNRESIINGQHIPPILTKGMSETTKQELNRLLIKAAEEGKINKSDIIDVFLKF